MANKSESTSMKQNGSADQQQTPVPKPTSSPKVGPRKLRVDSNESSKVRNEGIDNRDFYPECDGSSRASTRSPSSSRSRARGGRKDRSKRQIAAESQAPGDMQETGIYDNRDRGDDVASTVSSEMSTSRSGLRAKGGRKDRSKRQIASENQQLTGEQTLSENEREELQLREAERELYGHNDLPEQMRGERPDDSYLSDSDRSGENYDSNEDEGNDGGGRKVRDEVRQERLGRKPQRRRPKRRPETGVRDFSIHRADPNARPGKVTLEKNRSRSRQSHDHESEPAQQPSQERSAQQSRPQTSIPGISIAEGRPVQDQGQGQRQGEEQSPNAGKEVSIKFDLNVEVEILLKAKIKGEIMVTFM